jgi:membrane fusion protein, multidrug efflux system
LRRTLEMNLFTSSLLSLVVALFIVHGCSDGSAPTPEAKGAAAPQAVPIRAALAVQKAAPRVVRAIGTVQPSATVTVRPEVGGRLARVHFKEGQEIERGDLLFTIEPRPFEARLQQARAALARDQAQLENARKDEARYARLVAQGFVARQEYDEARTKAEALAATVRADRAQVEEARIELGHTSILAPMTGRTGNLLVHEGNVLKADETALVVINRIEPVFVSFSVPEGQLADIRSHQAEAPLAVEVLASESAARIARGTLTFIDNQVDPATGTIQLKAIFPNQAQRLWPGEFVDVAVTVAVDPAAIVVPAEAVQTGQQGTYVFVVKPDAIVESRAVVVERSTGRETVIARGVAPGEMVVTDGHLRLTPGARVEIKPDAPIMNAVKTGAPS